MTEDELVKNIIDDVANGYDLKNRLVFDRDTKRIRPSGYGSNPDSNLSLGAADTDFAADGEV